MRNLIKTHLSKFLLKEQKWKSKDEKHRKQWKTNRSENKNYIIDEESFYYSILGKDNNWETQMSVKDVIGYLKDKNKIDPNTTYKNNWKFDFINFDKGDGNGVIIEYNGPDHYRNKHNISRDSIKKQEAEKLGFEYYEFPFWAGSDYINNSGIGKYGNAGSYYTPFYGESSSLPANFIEDGFLRFVREFKESSSATKEDIRRALTLQVLKRLDKYRKYVGEDEFMKILSDPKSFLKFLNLQKSYVVPSYTSKVFIDDELIRERISGVYEDDTDYELILALKNIINNITNDEKLTPTSQEIVNKIKS